MGIAQSKGSVTLARAYRIHRADRATAAAGRATYTFDANGNQQIVREPAGARTTTTWNYENQPTLFRMPDGSRVTMTYNANNRRVDRE